MDKLTVAMIGWFALMSRRATPPSTRTYVLLVLGIVVLVSVYAIQSFVLKPLIAPAYP